jgi:hypothetical protein
MKNNCTYNLFRVNKPSTGVILQKNKKSTFLEGRLTEGAYLSASTNCNVVCEKKESFCPVPIQGLNFITNITTESKKWTSVNRTTKVVNNGDEVIYWEGLSQSELPNLVLCSNAYLSDGEVAIRPGGTIFPGVSIPKDFNGATLICVVDGDSYLYNTLNQSYFLLQTTSNDDSIINRDMFIALNTRSAFGVKEDETTLTLPITTLPRKDSSKMVLVVSFINKRITFIANGTKISSRSLAVSEWDSFSCLISNHEDSPDDLFIEEVYLLYGGLNGNVLSFINDLYVKHGIVTPSLSDKIMCYSYDEPDALITHVGQDLSSYDKIIPLRDMQINVYYDHTDFAENGFGILLMFKSILSDMSIIGFELDPPAPFDITLDPESHVYAYNEEPLDSINIIFANPLSAYNYSGTATLTFKYRSTTDSIQIPCEINIT